MAASFPKVYKPTTPRNVACWAVIQAFGIASRADAVKAIVDAGIIDTREWQQGKTAEQQAEAHIAYVEHNGWITWDAS